MGTENSFIESIINNVNRLRNMSYEKRERILERADKQIPYKIYEVRELVLSLCEEKGFCKSAGIDYCNIQAEDSRLIKTAIADYLMRTP